MRLDLINPCSNCPFRTDIVPYLGKTRVIELERELVENQKTFTCHKTAHSLGGDKNKEEQHCAGALILLEKIEKPNQMMRWMERIKFYNRFKLNMEAPVYSSFDQMKKTQAQMSNKK